MRALAHVVPSAVVQLLRGAPLSQGKVEFAWSTAVGRVLERATQIKLEGNVLIVEAASGPWVQEITRASPIILQRLQASLGESTVVRIEVRANPGLHVKPEPPT